MRYSIIEHGGFSLIDTTEHHHLDILPPRQESLGCRLPTEGHFLRQRFRESFYDMEHSSDYIQINVGRQHRQPCLELYSVLLDVDSAPSMVCKFCPYGSRAPGADLCTADLVYLLRMSCISIPRRPTTSLSSPRLLTLRLVSDPLRLYIILTSVSVLRESVYQGAFMCSQICATCPVMDRVANPSIL